jgi:hypothetical protein
MAGPAVAASFVVADSVVGLPLAAGEGWPRSELPPRLERWLAQGLSEPAAFLLQPPPLIRMRWELSRGRRRAFLEGTCAPATPGQALDHWQQARRVLARTSGLLRRWL